MVLSAAQGYTEVLSYLHHRIAAPLGCTNGGLSPLCAAIEWRQVDTCRLLLELGASPHEKPEGRLEAGGSLGFPLLHLAVARNNCEIVRLLIEHGATIDEPCDINNQRRYEFRRLLKHLPRPYHHRLGTDTQISPLRLAMHCAFWDVGLLLINSGAAATANDLFIAADAGHLQLVEEVVKMGIHPDDAVNHGINACQAALNRGHGLVANHLLAAGATMEPVSIWRIPNVACIQALLSCQFFPHPTSFGRDTEGRTYLENAILSGEKDVIILALSLEPDYYDSGAMCAAISLALRSVLPSPECVLPELLRRRDKGLGGSNCHVDPVLENTALSLAAWRGRLDIIALLLRNRPDLWTQALAVIPINDGNDNEEAWIHWREWDLPDDADNWHTSSYRQVPPLLFAIQAGNGEIADSLLDVGYKANGLALLMVIRNGFSFHLIQKMAETCDDIDAECVPDAQGGIRSLPTPLSHAAFLGRTEVVELLLARGANVNAATNDNSTALGVATTEGHLSLVDLLLSHGANVNEPKWSPGRAYAETVLQIAARKGYIGLVQKLLSRHADVNARRGIFEGKTALEAAASHGRLDVVQLLLNAGSQTEGFGRVQYVRAIALAANGGHRAVVHLLRSHRQWTEEDQQIWGRQAGCPSLFPASSRVLARLIC